MIEKEGGGVVVVGNLQAGVVELLQNFEHARLLILSQQEKCFGFSF
jgi:hypothetical protein